jgi:lysophospholipase L1-like esterase
MKKIVLMSAVCFSVLLSSLPCLAQTPKIRIMPLGDSITYGANNDGIGGGYRYPLYVALTNAGYNVDFVGTQTTISHAGLGLEINHEGHSGWHVSAVSNGLYENILSWLSQIEDPDVVLIHIGTNDTGDAPNYPGTTNELSALITRIATNRPYAHIIVTTLLKRGVNDLDSRNVLIDTYFNPYVEGIVQAHQLAGRRVHFLDMHAYLERTDMYDNLHPNNTGYGKMAAAWLPAITNIVTPYGDLVPPAVATIKAITTNTLAVTFSKPINLAASPAITNPASWAVSPTGTLTASPTFSADLRSVTLTVSGLVPGVVSTLALNGSVTDLLPASSGGPFTTSFSGAVGTFTALTQRGALNNVTEASDYALVYSLDIPSAVSYKDTIVAYSTDRNAIIPDGSFSRIAYYLELQKTGEDLQYIWVSMDSFTNKAAAIGVPTVVSGAIYQQYVSNMNIFCNVPGVTTGSAIPGNIEFWPSNYTATNAAPIINASNTYYDMGDSRSLTGSYGSMQIHNYGASQTLLSFSNWGSNGDNVCLGIGNDPNTSRSQYNPDWTFAVNGATYTVRHLQVYVKVDTRETTLPTAVSAKAGAAGTLITVEFSETLAADAVKGSCFSVNNGVTIISTQLLPDKKRVNIITTAQPTGASLTLTINNIRDLSGNTIVPNSTIPVTPYALPPEITTNAGALATGYKHIYTLDINPVCNFLNAGPEIYSYDQSSLTGAFDRVAYYLELKKKNHTTQYVWVSMDAFSASKSGVGVPTVKSGSIYQQLVNSMDVKSNVSGVTNGTNMAGGNIEFWPHDYSAGNAISIPDASPTAYDFGDTRSATVGYGSMQVHNYLAKQTIFAFNRWNDATIKASLGIGNRTGQTNTDWTHADNAEADYTERKLHILVRPSAAAPLDPSLPPQVVANVSSASNYLLTYTINLPTNGSFNSTPAQYYSVDNRAKLPPIFTRVAYYLETQAGTAPTQYIWTAMDKFTSDYAKLGVPVIGTIFQQNVTNLEVISSVAGIVNGSGITTGNIEFWPSNYNGSNPKNVPNASATYYDWGDGNANSTSSGHGSMQVHNYGASQTLFAINHFNANGVLAIGIGNDTGNEKDWTFRYNATSYNHRRLYVFVLPDYSLNSTTPAPAVVRNTPATDMKGLVLFFNTTLSDGSAAAANFSLNNGVQVTGATLMPNLKSIRLETSAMNPALSYTLTMNGVRARVENAIPTAGATYIFTPASPALPSFLGSVPEIADYDLSYKLAVSNTTYYAAGCNYTFDQSLFPSSPNFDRVAYCMELVSGGTQKWAYASMDAYATDLSKVGVPTADRAAVWQVYVNNMNVYSSDNAGVTNGTGIATGNIEFWPSNYSAPNTSNIINANSVNFDWGDSGFNTSAGHGSMQVHDYGRSNTIMSLVSFGSDNRTPGLGIGNNPNWTANKDPDWTHQANAATYTTKNIYVLTRQGTVPFTVVERGSVEILVHPQSQQVKQNTDVRLTVYAPYAASYQWLKDGVLIQGATSSQLEIRNVLLPDSASYTVVVTETDGDVALSERAAVQVVPPGTMISFE